jgi:PAS domain-containing protein
MSNILSRDELVGELEFALNSTGAAAYRWDLAEGTMRWDTEMYALFGLEPGSFSGNCWDVTERRRTTNALATLMDNLPGNIYFKDRESRFVAVNRAMLYWTGFKDQAEIIGKTDQDLFTEEHADVANG